MTIYDILQEGPTIQNDDKWLELNDGNTWTVKRLKAGTTHEQWKENGPEILYEGPDESQACEILLND